MPKSNLITLLTDFGTSGPYVAAMKGVIATLCPKVRVEDISHDIPAHDVVSGAFVLAHAGPCFPPETIHVAVVDPGVGTDRQILAARAGGQTYLLPDNGLLTFVQDNLPLEEVVTVTNSRYMRRETSMTFHGRDIFAPLACALAGGIGLYDLGPRAPRVKLLDIARPIARPRRIDGSIVYVDHFGNLVTNIPGEEILVAAQDVDSVRVFCKGQFVGALQGTYGFAEGRTPLGVINSMGLLEVAINQGRAAEYFEAGIGTAVHAEWD